MPDGILDLGPDGLPLVLDIGDRVDVPEPGSVVEKLADRDPGRRLATIIGKIGADRPVEIQPPLLRSWRMSVAVKSW